MSAELAVVEKYRMLGTVGCLQARGHLPCMKRVAAPVGVAGNEHCGWIRNTFTNLVIWGILRQRCEVARVLRSSVFIAPKVCVVEKMVSEHVEHRYHANHRAEQLRSLGHGRTDQQPGIRPAENGELVGRSSPRLDQPFRSTQKIVVSGLPVPPRGCFVPAGAKFRSPADIGESKQATTLQ